MIFNRLAIGTANWGKEYNGAKVSEDDQKRILDYAQCSGIDMLDTATAYRHDWTKVSSYFNVVVKVNKDDSINRVQEIVDTEPYIVMAHDEPTAMQLLNEDGPCTGVSLYSPSDYHDFDDRCREHMQTIQIPYSIADRRFHLFLPEMKKNRIEIHVRSIFLRGKLLEKFKPWECIAFCLMNPNIDRVIIGVDSYEQLKDNLRPLHRMCSAEIHDEKIIDPRKWETQQ